MDVQTCIDKYLELSKSVFTRRKRTLIGGAILHKVFGSPPFSAERLEVMIEDLLGSVDPPLHKDTQFLCKEPSSKV